MYTSQYGRTVIRKKPTHALSISYEEDDSKYPVLLFTPDLDDVLTHYHIELSRSQAEVLHSWLDAYLKDTE